MASGITIRENGTAEVCCVGETPWHKLGVTVPNHITGIEMLQASHTDWTVERRPLYGVDETGLPYELDGLYGMFRADTGRCLSGSVSAQYEPFQNRECIDLITHLMGGLDGAHYETGGSLWGGKQVFYTVKLQDNIMVGDDVTENYLLVSSGHDARTKIQARLCNTRVVCQNTLNVALQEAGQYFNMKHKRGTVNAIRDLNITGAVRDIQAHVSSLGEIMNHFAGVSLDARDVRHLTEMMYPQRKVTDLTDFTAGAKENQNKVVELFESNTYDAFPEQRGTAYAYMNAITAMVDHNGVARGENSPASNALFGAGMSLKMNMLFNLALYTGLTKEQSNLLLVA